jgi:hypothetical protein
LASVTTDEQSDLAAADESHPHAVSDEDAEAKPVQGDQSIPYAATLERDSS